MHVLHALGAVSTAGLRRALHALGSLRTAGPRRQQKARGARLVCLSSTRGQELAAADLRTLCSSTRVIVGHPLTPVPVGGKAAHAISPHRRKRLGAHRPLPITPRGQRKPASAREVVENAADGRLDCGDGPRVVPWGLASASRHRPTSCCSVAAVLLPPPMCSTRPPRDLQSSTVCCCPI